MSRWYEALLERQRIREAKKAKKDRREDILKAPRSPRLSAHSKKVASDGRVLHSGLECTRYEELLLLLRGGAIRDLKCQVNVHLTRAKILYIPDFRYEVASSGSIEFEEVKGFETETWRLKRRLWKSYGPGTLHVYHGDRSGRPTLAESIVPKGGVPQGCCCGACAGE